MARPVFQNFHPFTQFIFLLLLALISSILITLLGLAVGFAFFPSDDVMGMFSGQSDNIQLLKYGQALSTLGMFVFPVLIFAYLFSRKSTEFLQLSFLGSINYAGLLTVFLLTISLLPIIDYVGFWNLQMKLPEALSGIEQWMRNMESAGKIITEQFTKVDSLGGLMINLLVIAVLPAVGEEMMFRGAIQPLFIRIFKNKHVAVWVTAFFFSAIHMQFFGFLPRMLLGAFMGYLVLWSGSLWYSIWAHFINNGLGVILYYFYHKGNIDMDPESLGVQSDLWQLFVSIAVFTLLVVVFKKRILKEKELDMYHT